MNKTELINKIAELGEYSKKDAGKALDVVVEAITESLKELESGDSIQLVGFGTFKKTFKEEREGRNPANGATITIAATNKVSFTPGAALKNAINK